MNAETKERILQLYAIGHPLSKICQDSSMPCYGTILRHLKDDDVFRGAFEEARVLRGIHFEEKALEAAENASGKDDTAAERLRFDAYKWAAATSDQQRYGNRTTIEGNASKPLVFTVVTGVPRNEYFEQPVLDATGMRLAPPEAILEAPGDDVDVDTEPTEGSTPEASPDTAEVNNV
ncbi:MAG: hypothetical protein IPL34_20505 [Thiofilum sp.]|uniref:terminase small subunit-like protein n=1 Tax=Thiofilum sp. TaxID=2212733 RepID=UPI0025E8C2D3|nr:hypothetical protein [Thiofilum sp.]MBK8455665.1 hypothetical protein [Thiofilum sp.]